MTPETRNCSSFDVDELFADVIVAVPWPDCGWNWIEVGAAGVLEAHGLAVWPVAVSATTLTVKVWVVGVFVPSSKAVTVTVKLPVTPVGALSIKTPFCVSVMMLAEVILIGVIR